jgi:hypothetical protein
MVLMTVIERLRVDCEGYFELGDRYFDIVCIFVDVPASCKAVALQLEII